MQSDSDIMLLVQAGEISQFEELVARYRDRLLRFARSRSPHEAAAEDLVQDVFLAAFQGRHSYSVEFAFSTWVWTIALNLSRKQYRQRQREAQKVEDFARLPRHTLAESPLQTLTRTHQANLVHVWLNQIPEQQADAIRLRFFGELSFDDIALAMGSSVSGAKRRVKNGLLKLAELHRLSSGEW